MSGTGLDADTTQTKIPALWCLHSNNDIINK